MVIATLRQVGGSVMLAVPPHYLKQLNLGAQSSVSVTVDQGRLLIEPQKRPRYTLAELLSQCDASAPVTEEDRAWEADRPVGSELI